MSKFDLKEILESFGANRLSCIDLKAENPEPTHINYFDLTNKLTKPEIIPDVVVEFNSRPVLYAVSYSHLGDDPGLYQEKLKSIQRVLACRGDADYMAVVYPGKLEVFPIEINFSQSDIQSNTIEKANPESQFYIPSIAYGTNEIQNRRQHTENNYIRDYLFDLMKTVIDDLINLKVGMQDALSLSGRVLFFRFLIDRKIISKKDLKNISEKANEFNDCFANIENTSATCAWLDRVFNGNLLPVSGVREKHSTDYESFLSKKNKKVFSYLSNIISKVEALGNRQYQNTFSDKWDFINFAHVPVGLLSQLYENFTHEYTPEQAKKESVHYTPINIAEYMVEETFYPLKGQKNLKVLDPSCGAGIFLVTCFKKLVALEWEQSGKQPNRKKIREILYNQIVGFDINESALRLSALSLYLTALELDSKPEPLTELSFKEMQGEMLFHRKAEVNSKIIGSLEKEIDKKYLKNFDIVIGNPPWTSIKDNRVNEFFTSEAKRIVKDRGLDQLVTEYKNPDGVPDLPFIWKAMEWCKDNGRISFALHARLLFKNSDIGRKSSLAIFNSVKVTGILNGSALRQENIWPVTAPFCLFFAKNIVPTQNSIFNFVSPYIDRTLNENGIMRIDHQAAEPVELKVLNEKENLLKILFRGNFFDAGVIEKINKRAVISILEYWDKNNLIQGRGYGVIGQANDSFHMVKKKLGNLTIENLKEYTIKNYNHFPFSIESYKLPLFLHEKLHRPKDEKIYLGPLLLIKQTPSQDRDFGRGLVSLKDIIYDRSFLGYSAKSYPKAHELVFYLLLLIHSNLFLYSHLLSSSQFGVERDALLKEDIDNFKIIPFENLNKNEIKEILELSNMLKENNKIDWSKIDDFFYKLYGLNKYDIQVIEDTLEVSLPFQRNKERASQRPNSNEIKTFCELLEKNIQPFFKVTDKKCVIRSMKELESISNPWSFIEIKLDSNKESLTQIPSELFQLADESGSSKIIFKTKNKILVIGILKQYRYWTKTRARILSTEILNNYMDTFSK